jgi:hypothetical protein
MPLTVANFRRGNRMEKRTSTALRTIALSPLIAFDLNIHAFCHHDITEMQHQALLSGQLDELSYGPMGLIQNILHPLGGIIAII